jgi:hypothetical protein
LRNQHNPWNRGARNSRTPYKKYLRSLLAKRLVIGNVWQIPGPAQVGERAVKPVFERKPPPGRTQASSLKRDMNPPGDPGSDPGAVGAPE